jgi:leukotriene-A4 hydrolase
MKIFNILSVLLVLSLFACDYFDDSQSEEGKKIVTNQQIRESHSYSNINEVYTKHLHLDMEVDFDNNSIYGVARHTMINKGSDTAVFDIKGLEIQKVTLGEKEHEVNTNFVIGIEDTILGAPLSVKIDKKSTLINIYYKTTDRSEALDWLKPEMTKGKKFPYLYTQGQAILTRTWVPSQDRPSNRITYSADVKVPEGMMALMSAKNPTKKTKDGLYHFEMNQPIPVYLIALAVGNLEYRKIGKNCGVYSEPEMIRQVAWEFKDLRKLIVAAEGIYDKYQWEQYDVIILPYSFPFGGMENPRLTFANPTLLAGDRSLISVIAHELAHSWSGNLVTNATWDDFWLNEGFTVYFENRIMESLYGKDIADILALIEFQELKAEVKEISDGQHPEDTYLKLSLDGRNPDDGMTSVAYVKGAFFLKTLEEKVGREKFDVFVKGYFKKFQFQTLTTEIFEKYLEDHLLKPNKFKFNTKAWLYGKGIPKNCIKIVSPRFIAMQKMADDFNAGKDIFKIKVKKRRRKIDLKRDMYVTQEWLAFIRRLPRNISIDKLKLLDKKLDFKGWGNAEIATEWYILGVEAEYEDIRPNMEKFLKKVGRRKFLLPIYKTLAKRPADLKWAKDVYSEARANYHAVSQNTIDEILKFKPVPAKV